MTCRGSSLAAFRDKKESDKALALDRAIEFEDAWLFDRDKECHMIDPQLLAQLDAAAGEMKAAEDKIRAICARIAQATGDSDTLVPALGVTTAPKPRPKSPKSSGSGKGRAAWRTQVKDPVAGATKQFWKKTVCSVCHQTMGSRRYQDLDYPILHKNDQTGEACKGSFAVGLPIE